MAVRVLIAGSRGALRELQTASRQIQVVGHVRRLEDAEDAMRRLRPSVLVLDALLCHHAGLCSLPALRRASPSTAIVMPPEGEPGPRLVRAVRLASGEPARRRQDDRLTARERDVVQLAALG